MFQIQPNPTFDVDVTIPTPSGNGKLKITFKHKGRKELQQFLKDLQNEADANEEVDDSKVLLDVVKGWDGVDQKFSAEAFASLLNNYPSAPRAIMDAYVQALLDGKEKAKN